MIELYLIMSISKRHHYTPRYYLKRFQNHEGAMWRLDKDSGKVTRGNNEIFGFKTHWNRLRNPPEGYVSDWAERKLSEIDGPASAVVRRILAGEFPKDLRALCYAISFMQTNQPRLMRHLEENHAKDIQHWSHDFQLIARVSAALDNALDYVPIYYTIQMIDENDNDMRFLTSSNPLIEFTNKTMSFLPLSNRHCLMLSYDPQFEGEQPSFIACDKVILEGINKLSIQNAWQYVYSCTPDFSI